MFADELKKARKEADLTQEKLASLLNVDRTYVSKMEVGTLIPNNQILNKLTSVLNYDFSAYKTKTNNLNIIDKIFIAFLFCCSFVLTILYVIPIFKWEYFVYVPDGVIKPPLFVDVKVNALQKLFLTRTPNVLSNFGLWGVFAFMFLIVNLVLQSYVFCRFNFLKKVTKKVIILSGILFLVFGLIFIISACKR